MGKRWIPRKESIVDFLVLLLITLFIFSYFEPQYLFSKTTTTGGDTASHYYTAWYLKNHLLPKGQITGWTQGNYAGFPMLKFYFPLPFLLMTALSWVMPLQIAFKLVTVLGIVLLPVCGYFALRWMGYLFPVPGIGAIVTLPFLFMEANSMWGGNIPSTLAGEFCFSIGMSLSILFLGLFYRGITTGKHVVSNALLIFLIGFSHGYTLLFAGFTSLFFLWTTQDFLKKAVYLLKVHLTGFLLLGFWIVPLLAYLPFNSTFNIVWVFKSFVEEVFPAIFFPFLIFAGIAILLYLYRRYRNRTGDTRISYILYGIGVGALCYLIGFYIGIADIRFLPFVQYLLMLLGAIGFHACTHRLKGQWVMPGVVAILVLFWVQHHVTYIPDWIAWNYNGFEKKHVWPQFEKVNERLRGSPADPRIIYENSSQHNAAGTVRAFESIPLFSGRSTLEGLYMQASITAPFVFNIQSTLSKEASCPFVQYSCARYQIDRGIKYLEMFNVRDVVAISPEVKSDLLRHPKFKQIESLPPYAIYELTTSSNRYVVPLTYQPILLKTRDWKTVSYQWFKDFKNNDVPLVFSTGHSETALKRFREIPAYVPGDEGLLPRIPVDVTGKIKETIHEDEVMIETTLINKPHMVKISYHPNWKVEGADQIYLVSPSFMLIYPTQNKVRLYYGQSAPEYAGKIFSLIGWGICFLSLPLRKKGPLLNLAVLTQQAVTTLSHRSSLFRKTNDLFTGISQWADQRKQYIHTTAVVLAGLSIISVIFITRGQDATSLFQHGIQAKDKGDFSQSRIYFKKIMDRYPLATLAEQAHYFYAISYYLENRCEPMIVEFQQMIKHYPEAALVPEAYYHIGLCNRTLQNHAIAQKTFQFVIDTFPESPWAQYSRERLNEEILMERSRAF